MTQRSPIARVRGLGAAHDGTHHWWAQRLTAVALVPLTLAKGANSQTVLAELMKRGPVRRFEQSRPSLHDIFVRIANPKE